MRLFLAWGFCCWKGFVFTFFFLFFLFLRRSLVCCPGRSAVAQSRLTGITGVSHCPWPVFSLLTFDGASQVGLSGIKILTKERAVFFTLAYPLCENCNITLHHFNWAPMFQVHSVRKDNKATVISFGTNHVETCTQAGMGAFSRIRGHLATALLNASLFCFF